MYFWGDPGETRPYPSFRVPQADHLLLDRGVAHPPPIRSFNQNLSFDKEKTASSFDHRSLALVDAIGDILLMVGIAPESLVSCCTTVTDISSRPTRTTPVAFFGPEYARPLQGLFLVTHICLIGFVGVSLKFKIFRWPILGLLFLFSLLNAMLFLLSQIEVFAPAMMHLPFHHCVYCLWQYVPDSIAMYLFFILGTFSWDGD